MSFNDHIWKELSSATWKFMRRYKLWILCLDIQHFGIHKSKLKLGCLKEEEDFKFSGHSRRKNLWSFCYKKTYQNELQNQDSCSLQFKKSKVGTRAQEIHPLIDKVKDGFGVTKFKKLSKEQWLYDGDESIELFAAPQHFPFDVGEMSDLRTNPFKGGGDDAILIEPVEAYEWMQPRGCDFVDEPERMKTRGCNSVNEPKWMKTHGCDSVDEPNVQKEDPFAIYVGPITRLRSKKLSEKVVGLIQNLESEEELLGITSTFSTTSTTT